MERGGNASLCVSVSGKSAPPVLDKVLNLPQMQDLIHSKTTHTHTQDRQRERGEEGRGRGVEGGGKMI